MRLPKCALKWLAGSPLILSVLAFAQPVHLMGDDDAEKKAFVETDVKLPPLPKPENLLAFEHSSANTNRFFIDADSIVIGTDGIVRYTMVVKSPSGAENVSYEGIRCETTEQKFYAFGRRDGTQGRARGEALAHAGAGGAGLAGAAARHQGRRRRTPRRSESQRLRGRNVRRVRQLHPGAQRHLHEVRHVRKYDGVFVEADGSWPGQRNASRFPGWWASLLLLLE